MIDISEEKIKEKWQGQYGTDPLVTIRCMAFNHEKYIADALDSFLSQVTTFPFIIFVHDDCSTDKTRSIIEEYQAKFPTVIHAVLEDENIWSKKDNSISEVIKNNTFGKYTAVCEGDDYWIDNNKLQKQIEYLENNPECTFCFTNGKAYNVSTESYEDIFTSAKEKKIENEAHIINMDNVDLFRFPPTASYVYKNELCDKLDSVPVCPNGDLRRRLFYTSCGYSYYLPDKTCVYRRNVSNSAMTKWKKYSREQHYRDSVAVINMITYIDNLYNKQYTDSLWKIKESFVYSKLTNSRKLSVFSDLECKRVFKQLSLLKKIRVLFKILTPDVFYNKFRKKH